MALQGKYQQTHVTVKFIQWMGCILLLSIPAMGSILLFEQPLSVTALKWVQLIQTTAIFLLPPLCMAYLWSKQPFQYLHLTTPCHTTSRSDTTCPGGTQPREATLPISIALMLVALPAINLLSHLNQQMTLPAFLEPLEQWMKTSEENAAALTEQFLNVTTFSGLIINLLLMALLPAVAEELTFRGILQRLFQPSTSRSDTTCPEGTQPREAAQPAPRGSHLAIWCSAILFSAIHLQFYGFVPRMLMGALFGYMLVWTGSLWTPILMHLTNNAVAVLLYFLAQRAAWDMEKVDAIGTGNTLWLGIASIVLTIVGIYAFRRSTTIRSASSRISNGN